MLSKPYSGFLITDFVMNLIASKDHLTELQGNARINYPILNELVANVNEILRYLAELEMLAKGKTQVRHWNTLFDECTS
jgi:hypothetical protein